MNIYKVLVVEDEPGTRRGLITTTPWAEFGCKVVGEARNGKEGLEKAAALLPDIIITDEKMPLKSGLSMVEELQKNMSNGYNPKVILISAFPNFEYAKRAIELDVVAYLVKPFTDEELGVALTKAVSGLSGAGVIPVQERMRAVKSKQHNVQEVLSYIHEHYAEDIGLSDLAAHTKLSESYISHVFKEACGYSPVAYLAMHRIAVATELLSDPNIKVYEVADAVGYKDYRYFSRIFKRYMGVPPYYYKEHIE